MPEEFIKVSGVNTHYVVAGSGRPLLLLHGLGGHWGHWEANIPALAQHYRVYAPDIAGFGLSDKPQAADRNLEFLLHFLRGFLDVQEIAQAVVIGNSLGGFLALQMALTYPQRVSALVLVDAAGLGPEIGWILRLQGLPILGDWVVIPSRRLVRLAVRSIFYDQAQATPKIVEEHYRHFCRPGARQCYLAVIHNGLGRGGQRYLLLDRLPQISVPTLIVWGAQDRLLPVRQAHAAAARLPHSRLHVLPECGHCPQMEKPEEFNRLVLDFLAEVSPARAEVRAHA
ncbi:MAG: alpha/beta fold hydrolase [Chloroflexi bacterium]|nr:alpha/beta fold hydrolase [Chloroflexota bacterium]